MSGGQEAGGARQRTVKHTTVTPVGPNHTSGVPNPGRLSENTRSSISAGWARLFRKHLHTGL